ncbi:MAG: type II toxin-antitoxin system Phd/YefM family antitoxin [Nitrospirae bacterium]|nr:MAG: type II toxin-antitoxin system Phd/YefM family antitoxin [Nitrospirota bacterium]
MTAVKERRRAGKKGGNGRVVLSRRRYERLLEDLHDLAVVAERRNEPSISLEDIKKRLRKRGRL